MKRFLVVTDMQKDFVDGALGTPEAVAILEAAAGKIAAFEGEIFVTMDTHFENYLSTAEGKKLPVPHCIKGSDGWQLHGAIQKALEENKRAKVVIVEKNSFGSLELPEKLRQAAEDEPFSVELIGLCTDICVISNAILLKAHFPEQQILVDASCCAGVTPETHRAALDTMKMCQIEIK